MIGHCTTAFKNIWIILHPNQQRMRVLVAPHICQYRSLLIFGNNFFLMLVIPVIVKCHLIMVFLFILLMILRTFFLVLNGNLYLLFRKVFFNLICPFKSNVIHFLHWFLKVLEYLYILDTSLLSEIYIVIDSLLSGSAFFIFLVVS